MQVPLRQTMHLSNYINLMRFKADSQQQQLANVVIHCLKCLPLPLMLLHTYLPTFQAVLVQHAASNTYLVMPAIAVHSSNPIQ